MPPMPPTESRRAAMASDDQPVNVAVHVGYAGLEAVRFTGADGSESPRNPVGFTRLVELPNSGRRIWEMPTDLADNEPALLIVEVPVHAEDGALVRSD